MLNFAQYKAQSITRTVGYDPKGELSPYSPWYSLDFARIAKSIRTLCQSLLGLTNKRSKSDTEIGKLHTALQQAKTVSRKDSICVAILGEQGAGKSQLLCSIMSRNLVHVSASAFACTAFPTIVEYKYGASDDTRLSDVIINYLLEHQIRECVCEQALRYRDGFPRKRRNSRANDFSRFGSFWNLCNDDSGYDDDYSDQEEGLTDAQKEEILASARTALNFFEIIFDADENQHRRLELNRWLESGDISSEDFIQKSLFYAQERLSAIGADKYSNSTTHLSVADEDLSGLRKGAEKLWPLVQSMRIKTGHRLLRNNLSFLDLPGYGDDNKIRTALIQDARERANFEIVVAPAQRIATSDTHNKYLKKSIRRVGSDNTLLVANKSDQLLDDSENEMRTNNESPFKEAQKNLLHCASLKRLRQEDPHLLLEYENYVMQESGAAYLLKQRQRIATEQKKKNIEGEVLLVSAKQYKLCLEQPDGLMLPKITADATGIPELRQFLLHLPAERNYSALDFHVYDTLPDIVNRARRILSTLKGDETYTEMRKHLRTSLPTLREDVEELALDLVSEQVVKPWGSDKAEDAILRGIRDIVERLRHPTPYYATFNKMMQENGAPVNGKAKGRNLNNEIMLTMEKYIRVWHTRSSRPIKRLVADLNDPLQKTLDQLKQFLDSMAQSDLRRKAENELVTRVRRIDIAKEKLEKDLSSQLRSTCVRYTTETHAHCPVVLAMKDHYRKVVVDVAGGKGAYAKRRDELMKCVCPTMDSDNNFAATMADNIVTDLNAVWTQCCNEFLAESMAQLEGFREAADELLDNGSSAKAEHRRIREDLEHMLPEFQEDLEQIQDSCPRLELAAVSGLGKRKAYGRD